jgi:hypothetical protein
MSAAATAVSEDDYAHGIGWHPKVAVQDHSGGRDLNRTLKITAHHPSVSPPQCLHPLASAAVYERGGRAAAHGVAAPAYDAAW